MLICKDGFEPITQNHKFSYLGQRPYAFIMFFIFYLCCLKQPVVVKALREKEKSKQGKKHLQSLKNIESEAA